jgi:hypothetical protein
VTLGYRILLLLNTVKASQNTTPHPLFNTTTLYSFLAIQAAEAKQAATIAALERSPPTDEEETARPRNDSA